MAALMDFDLALPMCKKCRSRVRSLWRVKLRRSALCQSQGASFLHAELAQVMPAPLPSFLAMHNFDVPRQWWQCVDERGVGIVP